MRIRTVAVFALLSLPCALSAQRIRLPRIGRGAKPEVAPLPPAAEPVARALAYKRSRWSTEAYTLISSVRAPDAAGGAADYTTFGTGTRADYRYSERFSATLDMTVSALGGPATTSTAEAGTRFTPLPADHAFRPFFDLRAAYTHLSDSYGAPLETSTEFGASNPFIGGGRYSRGFGGVAGAGFEYSLTARFALTSELSAVRSRMTAYKLVGSASTLGGTAYSMDSFRYTLGLKFNLGHAMHLAQKPTS